MAKAVATTAPQTPDQPPASSAPQLFHQPAASPSQDRLQALTSSLTAHQPDQLAAGQGVQVPVQVLASSIPQLPVERPGTMPVQELPAHTSLANAGQRAASTAGQMPVQTGASTLVQRYPAQSGPPAAGQQSRLDDIASTVMATMHPAAQLGQPAAFASSERFPSMPNASLPAPKLALPQSPFRTSGSVHASSVPAPSATASEKTPESPGQRAAQSSPSIAKITRQTGNTHVGHDKAVADETDGASKEKAVKEKVLPGDRALGTGQIGEPSQHSQQAKSPFRKVLRSPLHYEHAWEDTDDEDGMSNGDPSEVDWERHITASAIPQPAGARPAPAANGHQSEGTAFH